MANEVNDGMNSLGFEAPKDVAMETLINQAAKAGVTPVQINLGIGTSGSDVSLGSKTSNHVRAI